MDKIIRVTLCLLIVIAAAFAGIVSYNTYVDTAYLNTLTGTCTYTCSITLDAPLYNVTLFIPVPADKTGNSPVVTAFGSRTMKGIPADWETTLFDTGKTTLLKVTTPSIIPPEGTTASNPYTVTFSFESASRSPIDTRDPEKESAMFRPVQALSETACGAGTHGTGSRCFTYTTSLYADYTTAADTTLTMTSSVQGKNSWTIFEPRSNEYFTEIHLAITGENHGWATVKGTLTEGTGSYDPPFGT